MSVDEHLAALLQLLPGEQHLIAERLAANVGYVLAPKPQANLPAVAKKAGVGVADVDWAIARWNDMAGATEPGNPAHRLPKVRKLNPANRKALALRLGEFGREGWEFCLKAIFRSAHCRGVNDRGWKADISYLLQPKGSNKTINGGWPADYEERSNGGKRVGPGGRGDQRLDSLRSFNAAVRGGAAQGGGRDGGGEEDRQGSEAAGGGPRPAQHRLAFSPAADGE